MKWTTVLRTRLSKFALENEKEWTFKMPWGNVAALSWGDQSNPPVLLCQGRLDSCSTFRPLVRHLPKDYFYLSIDLPGNGRSEHYPRPYRISIPDFVPPLERIVDYLKWDKFDFIGHSLGAAIGKYFNVIFPNVITRMVDIDPEPAYLPLIKDLRMWYRQQYKPFYGEEGFELKGPESAPKYSYEEARSRLMKARGLTAEVADSILERCLESVGDGLYRFTFDQRFRRLVYPVQLDLQNFFTSPKTPTLGIFASETIARGSYNAYKFCLDDAAWKHGNYRHIVLEGGHDIHLHKTEEVARLIEKFFNDNSRK